MSLYFDINLFFEKYLNDFFEKTNYNDLKKSTKYQIRFGLADNNVTYGVFVGYNKELNNAIFNVKNNDVLTLVSYRSSIYTFYRLISIEEHNAKIKPFRMFQKLYKITTGEKYKIIYGIAYTGLVTRKLCFGDGGSYSIEHLVFYNNEWVLMKYFNTSKIPIEYYRFVSEEEYRKKRREKFNENALKTILNRLIGLNDINF